MEVVWYCYYLEEKGGSYSAATTSMLKVCALQQILALIHVHLSTLHAI